MKTTKEWFETLDEKYKDKALKNMTAPLSKHHSLLGAISNGFDWNKSQEGIDYWKQVFREIRFGITPVEEEKTPQVIESKVDEPKPLELKISENTSEEETIVKPSYSPINLSQISSLNELDFSVKNKL